MRRLFVITLACLLAACAQQSHVKLYSGEPLPANQVLTVIVPNELEIRSLNGQPHAGANAMFGTADRQLQLLPGAYQVQAFYKNGFDIDGGISHEVVRGRTALFSFEGKPGEVWRLAFHEPQNLAEAQAFATEFPAWVENARTGERHAATAGSRPASVLGALLNTGANDPEPTSVAPLQTGNHSIVQAPVQPATRPVAPTPAPAAADTLPHNDATLATLQQLWNLLSPESRAAFLEWAQP